MSPRTINRPFWHRLIWPEAPQRKPAPLGDALLEKFCEVCHYAAVGNLGADADDLRETFPVETALIAILRDFRAGKAQTPPECALGQALHHIATKYLEA
jgi:hypothetical protein